MVSKLSLNSNQQRKKHFKLMVTLLCWPIIMTSLVDYVTSWWSVEWRGCIHQMHFPLLAIDKTGPGPDYASSRYRAFFVDCWAFESYFESKHSMLHYIQ